MLSLDESAFQTLYRNLIVLFLLLSLVPLAITGWLTFRHFEHSLHETITEDLAKLAASKSLAIENWLFEREADVQVLAGADPIIEGLKQLTVSPHEDARHQALQDAIYRHLVSVRDKYGCYDAILLLSAQGEAVVDTERTATNYADAAWFQQGRLRLYTSEVFLYADHGRPVVMVCHPVKDGSTTLGVLTARVTMSKIAEIMQDIRLGETGETYLVNRAGYFLTESRFTVGYPLNKQIETYGVRRALQEHATGAGEYTDYRGLPVLGAYAWMPSRHWALLAEQDSAEAFQDVHRLQRYFLGISFAAALLIVSVTFWVARELVGRLREDARLLREKQEQLIRSERLASVGRLAAGVAHEINNPISTISTIAQLMGRRHRDATELKQQFDTIEEQADRCALIVQGLLDFSHQSPPERVLVDVYSVLDSTLGFLEHQITRANVKTVTAYADEALMVWGDPAQLMQVCINLILNAVHAMPHGGKLTITTARDEKNIQVTFEDTGQGIPEDQLPLIFEPFFTTKDPGEGTGLGLAISHTIIEQHQGEIAVTSTIDEGSLFTVTLPIANEMEPQRDPRTIYSRSG